MALVVLGAVVLAWRSSRPTNMAWRDKPASYWIGHLSFFDLDTGSSAEEFLFASGPQVVPELIRGLDVHDRWLSDRWVDLYFKLGKWQRHFPSPVKRSTYRANCARGLGLIGPAASNAVPALLKCLEDPNPWVRSAAAESLGRMGGGQTKVLEELSRGLSSTNANYKLACLIGLSHCASTNAAWGRALRPLLQDPDSNIRVWTAQCLWRDRVDCETSVASLIVALGDSHPTVRDRAAESLGKVPCTKSTAANALKEALEKELLPTGNEIVQWKIIASLGQLAATARPAIPLLTNLITATNHSGVLALVALSQIETNEPRWIDGLVARLSSAQPGDALWAAWELGKHRELAKKAVMPLRQLAETTPDWRTQIMAATAAWRLEPSFPSPIPLIREHLSRRDTSQYEMVRLVGELGPAARELVPVLQQLRYNRGIMMHDYANSALQAVAPEYFYNPWLN